MRKEKGQDGDGNIEEKDPAPIVVVGDPLSRGGTTWKRRVERCAWGIQRGAKTGLNSGPLLVPPPHEIRLN